MKRAWLPSRDGPSPPAGRLALNPDIYMHLYICVCIYVCVCTYTHLYTHIYTYIYIDEYGYIHGEKDREM